MAMQPGMSNRQLLLFIVVWLALLAGAFALDRPAAQGARESGLEHWTKERGTAGKRIAWTAKLPGNFLFWLAPIGALCVWHRLRLHAGGFVLVTASLGLLNSVFKWSFGRLRPFKPDDILAPFDWHPFPKGIIGLFVQPPNLSFPSGHCSTVFAAAASMALLLPRWRWGFYAIAVMVAAERVAENAHYVSDTVAAAGISIIGVHLMWRIFRQMLSRDAGAAQIESVIR